MSVFRKLSMAAMFALAALLVQSSFGDAGTTWGGRSYTVSGAGFTLPGGTGIMLLSAPAPTTGRAGTTILSAAGGHGPAFVRPASDKSILCPDPCLGTRLGVDGSVSGLGSSGQSISMGVQADVLINCTNQGGNNSPGQNLVVLLTDSVPYNAAQVTQNGRFFFSSSALFVDGSGSQFPIGASTANGGLPGGATVYGCANDNWTATVSRYQFLCSQLTATLDNGAQSSIVDIFNSRCTLSA